MPRTAVVERFDTEAAVQSLRVDDLKPLVRLLTSDVPTRKDALVGRLMQTLQDTSQLRTLYEGMNELSQAAVREATHDSGGHLDRARFTAKYGQPPSFGSGTTVTTLRLFFPAGWTLPVDLQPRLLTFVPPPRAAAVATSATIPERIEHQDTLFHHDTRKREIITWDEPVQVRETEREALHDLPAVLRLIDAGKVSVSATTRRPGQAALKAVASVLQGGDFYTGEEEDLEEEERADLPIQTFAWPLIVQAAGFAGVSGSKLQLAAAGRKAMSSAPQEGIRSAWNKWLRTTLLDELNRVNIIKGQSGKGKSGLTAGSRRRETIAAALRDCPPGEWIAVDALFRYMQATQYHFEVTRNLWSLYISDANYGNLGYDGHHDWELLQGRYTLALLFEYAATLGLIDVAYVLPGDARRDYRNVCGADDAPYFSRYDGLLWFRINALGAWVLGLMGTLRTEAAARPGAFTQGAAQPGNRGNRHCARAGRGALPGAIRGARLRGGVAAVGAALPGGGGRGSLACRAARIPARPEQRPPSPDR